MSPASKPPKPAAPTKSQQASGETASALIDQRIRELKGWRGDALARMRAHNGMKAKEAKPAAKATKTPKADKITLLSGGNPQIAKADGDAPVQAYIAAMPGWKSDIGKRIDSLIMRNVPNARKAVKWNSPFYGIQNQGWFLSFHVQTRYVKVTFFNGAQLKPMPPGGTPKSKDARWIDIHESDELNEEQIANWVKQSAALPGWNPAKL
jgi:hypothetical protein